MTVSDGPNVMSQKISTIARNRTPGYAFTFIKRLLNFWVFQQNIEKFMTFLLTTQPTPCWRDIIERLIITETIKIFPAFYGKRTFITAITIARHLYLSWAINPFHAPILFFKIHFNNILCPKSYVIQVGCLSQIFIISLETFKIFNNLSKRVAQINCTRTADDSEPPCKFRYT
jgi:hypothetical protein